MAKVKGEIQNEHIISNTKYSDSFVCANCPMRLYNKEDDKIVFGIGNIITDTILILPSYDVKAKIGYNTLLNIIQDCYKNITGSDILENYYITRYIKCMNKTSFELYDEAIKSCYIYLYNEIKRIKPRKIISFDKNYTNYLYNGWNIILVKDVISPGVMYYDNDKLKDIFMKQFKEAIFC